jgi:phosphate transport system protein
MALRVAYDVALDTTNLDLVRLGSSLTEATRCAIQALGHGDISLAARVVAGGDGHEELRRTIEAQCVELLWRQQPAAGELRTVAGMLEIASDASRINHFTTEIAKNAIRIVYAGAFPAHDEVVALAADARATLTDAFTALRTREGALAQRAIASGPPLDERYNAAIAALQAAMERDPKMVGPGTTMLFIITSLLRIAEHAVNVAEQTKDIV